MIFAGGAPLQWRVMIFRTASVRLAHERAPKEHEKTRHWSGAPPAMSQAACRAFVHGPTSSQVLW
jgi:hypothetical protein